MTEYQPYRKGTVLAPTGPCNHLHVICNDPIYSSVLGCFCVLVVNISSIKDGVPFDDACVLDEGDHRFIRHPSYVVYAEAIVWRVDNMVRKQMSGEICIHDDMSEVVFGRIIAGFDTSDEVAPKYVKFKNKHCLQQPSDEQLTGS